jgi:membrane fusion protein, type I secretion system
MKIIDSMRDDEQDERLVRRRADGSEDGADGPQGAALILELQRLRQAFDQENGNDRKASPSRRPARDERQAPPRPRAARPRRRKKGKVGRVLDAFLGPFGFQPDGVDDNAPPPRRTRAPRDPHPREFHPRESHAPESHPRESYPREPFPRESFPRESFTREPAFTSPPIAGGDSGSLWNSQANARPARGPIIASDPSLINIPKPARKPAPELMPRPAPELMPRPAPEPMPRQAPEVLLADDKRPQLRIEAPQLAPPGSLPAVTRERPGARMVDIARNGLTAGVAFLANRDGSADERADPGESIIQRAGRAFEHELRTGLRALIVVGGLGGGWMALVPLSGAVVVPGNLVVQSNVKTIQHPTGGVVAQIPVKNGMRVNAGDLLLRLDATQAQASLQVVSKQLDDARAKVARLIAERDGLPRPAVPVELSTRLEDNNVKTLLASEASLFKARVTARESQKELLQSKMSQLGEEIAGLEAQVGSKAKQLELITGELTGVQELFDKRLVPLARLTTLQRESARIEGERGQLISTIAETKSKIDEAKLQIVRIDQDARTEIVKDLGDAQGKEAELSERSIAARDVLDRIEMRAPTSGVVHQLAAHTIGGVIRAGDAIMEVVPDSDDLQIEAKLQPNDIDQVRKGQQAYVRFSAFNQRTTPQLIGEVSFVSPDTTRDQQTNMSYFTVRITLPEEERRRLAGLQLVSGMPAEVFMQTGSRTMLSYLFKPIVDQLQRAFVER